MYYSDSTILYLDGQYLKASDSKADLYGQTLHYGYGVFEGIRAYDTESGTSIFKAKEHYERLINSSAAINIPFEYSVEELTKISYEILEKNNLTNAYLRPLVFCAPNMSLTRPNGVSLMIAAWEWGAYLGDKLLRLKISSYCRPHPRSTKINAKVCGHYVNSTLATTEAKDNGYDEALLLDSEGFVAEGSGANLFFEKNGKLYTPQLGNILPGITRATVIEICNELGIDLEEGLYTPGQLKSADSAFYCGTAAEVIGIQSIDDDCTFPLAWENTLGFKIQKAYKDTVLEKK